jgi:hypothetical protein
MNAPSSSVGRQRRLGKNRRPGFFAEREVVALRIEIENRREGQCIHNVGADAVVR